MTPTDEPLLGGLTDSEAETAPRHTTGLLPGQTLRAMIHAHEIGAAVDIRDEQIQPASLDLRLGNVAYRIRASFLPGEGNTVRDKLDQVVMHEIDLTKGAVLETGCVYLCPLMEHLNLGWRVSGSANAKSSTGRLDVFTRLVTNRMAQQLKQPFVVEDRPGTEHRVGLVRHKPGK